MGLVILVVIGVVIYWIYHERVVNSPSNQISRLETVANSFLESMQRNGKHMYGETELDDNITRMKNWYIRLKEKNKHDIEKSLQLAIDWKDYTLLQNGHSTDVFLMLEHDDPEISKEIEEEIKENVYRMHEIENRFARQVGEDAIKELEDYRNSLKKQG